MKDVPVMIRMPQALKDKAVAHAILNDMSLSQYIRKLIKGAK